MQYLDAISKTKEWSLFCIQGKSLISQSSKSMPWPIMLRSWSWIVLWRPNGLSRTNTKKRCTFHHRRLECKIASQDIPGTTGKFGLGVQNEAGQRLIVLPREHTGHSKHPFPQEETLHMDIKRWSIQKSDWLYSLQPKMQKFYTVSKNKTRSWLWLRSQNPSCPIQT